MYIYIYFFAIFKHLLATCIFVPYVHHILQEYYDVMDGNITFDPMVFYDYMDTYEFENMDAWLEEFAASFNKVFVGLSIVLVVMIVLLLLTVFNAHARESSASWYLYHLNFVTVLQVVVALPMMEANLHATFGACMFFSFAEWTLAAVYWINMTLMNIEIMATLFVTNPKWKWNPQQRFLISMAATWISCMLFSVFVSFFGHDENDVLPVCFHQNSLFNITRRVGQEIIPTVILVALTITGIVVFVRSKRRPENYSHVAENQNRMRLISEWFVCLMVWNVLIFVSQVMLYEIRLQVFSSRYFIDVILQMTVFLVHVGVPLCCLFISAIRTACREAMLTVCCHVCGRGRTSQTNVNDTQMLQMESSQ